MEFLASIVDFFYGTGIPEQLSEVDIKGLFTNPWFMVPFLAFIGYQVYKQSFNTLVILAVIMGLWMLTGSPLMQDMVVDGELQLGKVLPVAGIGVVALGIIVYFVFMRSD